MKAHYISGIFVILIILFHYYNQGFSGIKGDLWDLVKYTMFFVGALLLLATIYGFIEAKGNQVVTPSKKKTPHKIERFIKKSGSSIKKE